MITIRGKVVKGQFVENTNNKIRKIYRGEELVGMVTKLDEGGYRITRMDGKVRERKTLEEAYLTCARAN